MVQLVEITGVLNEKGCIEIPIVLLAQTGIRTGEEVNLIYLAAGEKDYRNESREFMLKRAEEDPLEELQSGETELKLPPQLLADAHMYSATPRIIISMQMVTATTSGIIFPFRSFNRAAVFFLNFLISSTPHSFRRLLPGWLSETNQSFQTTLSPFVW